jgi:hypothetical protein
LGFSTSFSGRFDPVEEVLPGGACLNYTLTKYQGRHNSTKGPMKETYSTIKDAIAANRELSAMNDRSLLPWLGRRARPTSQMPDDEF